MYNVLHTAFTDIAKNRLKLAEIDIRSRRTELHDHLFAVLSLVDEALLMAHLGGAGATGAAGTT